MRSNFSLIEQAHRRLAKVVIENKDFEKLLHQYDRPVSFFYLDPPYHATEGYYADKQELEESIIRRHYGTIVMDSEQPQGGGTSAGGMAQGIQAAPDSRKTVFRP